MSGAACRTCGATLVESDRFCPACGTPYSDGKFHPRLPRSVVEHEAYDEVELGAGETPCRRCGRGVRPDEPFCRTCGFQLVGDDPWKREAARLARDPRPLVYEPIGFLTTAVRWLLRCVLAAAVVSAGISLLIAFTARDLRGRAAGGPVDRLMDLRDLRSIVVPALAGVGVLAAVVVGLWLRRALVNLRALGATPAGLGASWAVPGMLLPGVNLVAPVVLLAEAWKGSDPERADLSEGAWRRGWVPASLWLGWGLFLLFGVMVVLGASWDPSGETFANDQFSATLDTVAFSLLGVSMVVLHLLVAPLDERQTDRARALGLAGDDELATAPSPAVLEPPAFHEGETWGVY